MTSPPAFHYTPSEFRWRGASAVLFSSLKDAHPQIRGSNALLSGEHFLFLAESKVTDASLSLTKEAVLLDQAEARAPASHWPGKPLKHIGLEMR